MTIVSLMILQNPIVIILVELEAVGLLGGGCLRREGLLAAHMWMPIVKWECALLVCGFSLITVIYHYTLGVHWALSVLLCLLCWIWFELKVDANVRVLIRGKLLLETHQERVWPLVRFEKVEQKPGELAHVLFGVGCARGQLFVPGIFALHDLFGEIQRTHRQVGGIDMNRTVIKKSNFNHIFCEISCSFVGVRNLDESFKEVLARHKVDIKIKLS